LHQISYALLEFPRGFFLISPKPHIHGPKRAAGARAGLAVWDRAWLCPWPPSHTSHELPAVPSALTSFPLLLRALAELVAS